MDAGIGQAWPAGTSRHRTKATVLDIAVAFGASQAEDWRIASGRREREGMAWMQASGAKATVLDCMGGDGEGNCASLQA